MEINLFTEKEIRELEDDIKLSEGERFVPYDDATGKPIKDGDQIKGYPTIAVGFKLSDTDNIVKISQYTSRTLLRGAVFTAIIDFLKIFGEAGLDYPKEKRNVLIEFCYCNGGKRAAKYKKMIAAVKIGDWNQAAIEMQDSAWGHSPAKNRVKKMADILSS